MTHQIEISLVGLCPVPMFQSMAYCPAWQFSDCLLLTGEAQDLDSSISVAPPFNQDHMPFKKIRSRSIARCGLDAEIAGGNSLACAMWIDGPVWPKVLWSCESSKP